MLSNEILRFLSEIDRYILPLVAISENTMFICIVYKYRRFMNSRLIILPISVEMSETCQKLRRGRFQDRTADITYCADVTVLCVSNTDTLSFQHKPVSNPGINIQSKYFNDSLSQK